MGGETPPTSDHSKRYKNPPIVEAILDLRVRLPEGVSVETLYDLYGHEQGFGPSRPIYPLEQSLDEEGRAVQPAPVGYSFESVDRECVVHASLDRFSVSKLPPYTSWGDFLARAEAAWSSYRKVATPVSVVAIGVRFVNRIDVPQPAMEIDDYLRTSVKLSPDLPQTVAGFYMQVAVPLEQYQAQATIISGIAEPPEEGYASLVLDIDVTTRAALATSEERFNDALLEALGKLRDAKNYVFESCITDATRGLIS
ncbi:TIGR04255 family protein [Rhodococcus electrodiphilus]|uniref:TIGR04255 family protein n=1 Tax=Rhodococcus ruber TaxID=1830 RepID=UPI0026F4140C|nr:TIGR04255 family protein [Rhodococcus ruber]MDO2381611.1 TIGR04255 family protein [Rhodococcus ruber]